MTFVMCVTTCVDFLLHFFFCQLFLRGSSFHTSGNPGRHICIDENLIWIIIPQNIVSTAANNNTVRLLCQLLQHLSLSCINRFLHHKRIIHPYRCKSSTNGHWEQRHRTLLYYLLNISLRQICLTGYLGYNFFIIVFNTEIFRQATPGFI